eukprot:6365802-Heterocapsa_arctica.AAC.1
MLRRPCTCRTTGPSRCPPHRLAGFLARFQPGQRLWQWTAAEWKRLVVRSLTLLQVEGASTFTLKGIRAGKATELAKSGQTLGTILAA